MSVASPQLINALFCFLDDAERADLWVLNSCTVKGPSEDSFRNSVASAKELGKALVIAGCVPQGQRDDSVLRPISAIGVRMCACVCVCYRQNWSIFERAMLIDWLIEIIKLSILNSSLLNREEVILPWPKNLRQRPTSNYRRVHARQSMCLRLLARGCPNFFGQGSSMHGWVKLLFSFGKWRH